MSTTNELSDSEWQVVTKHDKRRVTKKKSNIRRLPSSPSKAVTSSDRIADMNNTASFSASLSKVQECLIKYCEAILHSSFFDILRVSLSNDDVPITQIVCYGIGNFWQPNSPPMWQLACALELRNYFKCPIFYFEPQMTEQEADLLQSKEIVVIPENEQARRLVDKPTLFFMPHCPMELYCNLMHTNWCHLDNVIIFGNSLLNYAGSIRANVEPNDDDAGAVHLLEILQPFFVEKAITMSKDDLINMPGFFEHAFNDSYLTRFQIASDSMPQRPANTHWKTAFSGELL